LQTAKRLNGALPVVVMTAFGTVETAVGSDEGWGERLRAQAFCSFRNVDGHPQRVDVSKLREENRSLREALDGATRIRTSCSKREDAGGAGAGGACGADQLDGSHRG